MCISRKDAQGKVKFLQKAILNEQWFVKFRICVAVGCLVIGVLGSFLVNGSEVVKAAPEVNKPTDTNTKPAVDNDSAKSQTETDKNKTYWSSLAKHVGEILLAIPTLIGVAGGIFSLKDEPSRYHRINGLKETQRRFKICAKDPKAISEKELAQLEEEYKGIWNQIIIKN